MGGTATGETDPTADPNARDHDWFAVSLEAGKTYRVEVRGSETGDGTLDNPILVGLYDASGTFVGGGDDDGGAGRNSLTFFAPETTGTYYVAARAHNINTGTYTVAVEEVPQDDFSASIATTGTVAVGGTATGEITPTADPNARDHDWFAVSLEAGKAYRVEVKGSDSGDGTLDNPVLVGLYDASGTFVGGGDDNGGQGRNSLRDFAPETTGTYYVAARAHGNNAGTYTVAVAELGDDFSASIGTPGTVAVGGTATGEITVLAGFRDHDWFAVSLEAGKLYRVEVRGSETGDGTLRDPILVGLYDAAGTFVGGGDDNGGQGRNSLTAFAPGTSGTYYVAARAHGVNTGTYTVAVTELAVSEDDFSASTATTGTVTVGGTATGEINDQGDRDWFAVSLEAGKAYRVEVRGSETGDGTLADPVLVGLYDASGTFVGGTGDDNSGQGRNSLTVFTPETTGTYYVAARAHGADIGTYTVAVAELEDDFSATTATTGTVAVGGTATGEINYQGDHDWFAVSLEAGRTYRVDVRGSETGDGTLYNPVLVGLYDASGTFVGGTGDDNGGQGRNSLTVFTPETAGTYYVAARAQGTNYNTGTYTVAVVDLEDDFSASLGTTGTVAVGGTATGEIASTAEFRDHDWFAVSLEAGKTYRVDVRGSETGDGTLADPILVGLYDAAGTFVGGGDDNDGQGRNSLTVFAPETTGTYYVAARAHNINTGTYTVAVTDIAVSEDDFSATTATTGTVAVGGTATGEITVLAGPRDHDWFAVSLEAGKTYRVDVRGSETGDGTLADPILVGLYDAAGTFVGGGDDDGGAGRNSLTFFAPETAGTYYVAARAHGNNAGTYTVAVEEVPQDDFSATTATTGTVAVGGTATGEITPTAGPRDHDWFAVSLEAGRTYRVEVRGSETGDGTLADPILVGLYDAAGTFVGGGDDNGGAGRNSLRDFAPETTGTYYVAARAHGNNAGTYTVAVGEISQDDFSSSTATTGTVAVGGTATGEINDQGDRDWFAVSLEAGRTYRVDVRGSETEDGTLADPILVGLYDASGTFVGGTGDDNGGQGRNSLTVFTPETAGTYYVAARAHDTNTGTYTVAVADLGDDFSSSTATTGTVAVGGTATGEINLIAEFRDHDWFAVSLEAGKTYRVEVRGSETGDGTLADPILVGLYDAAGTFVGGGDDNGGQGRNSLTVFAPETTGTYYVAARAHNINTGTYTVTVGEVPQDDFSASTATTGTIAVGGTATGELTPTADPNARDHDWFAVSLETGKAYRVEVRGADSGDGTLADPVLVGLYDAAGTFVGGTDDDNSGAGLNSLTVFTPETAGTYYVAARAHGNNAGTYTVAVGEVPQDDYAASATVEMGAVRVVEGGTAAFTVRLSHAAASEVTVEWSVGGTVTAGDDYTGGAGPFVLTFAAGETEKTIEIPTLDDATTEGDETLTVTLSNPTGATLGSTVSASVTIADADVVGQMEEGSLQTTDDDAPQQDDVTVVVEETPPEVSIADVSVTEGATARLTLSLDRASASEVSVYWSSSDGTAGSGDYTGSATARKVVFAPGETSKAVDIATVQDDTHEGEESFTVTLSAPEGATLGSKSSAVVTIADDDAPPEPPVELRAEDETPSIGLALEGTQGSDTLTGGDRDDRIDGLGGDDVLDGGGGDDLLFGGAGRDVLRGGAGDDLLGRGPWRRPARRRVRRRCLPNRIGAWRSCAPGPDPGLRGRHRQDRSPRHRVDVR